MSSSARHRADPAGDGQDAGPAPDDDAPLSDVEQLGKDRAYSPSSERETELKQNESADAGGLRPGTGGPDDSGDLPAPDDVDLASIVDQTDGRRPGEG